MINAIFRRSAEIDRMEGSRKSNTYGPNTMPVMSIPMILGSFSLWQIAPIASPTRKISANDVNIFFPPFCTKKADGFCDFFIVEVISSISSSGIPKGELHSLYVVIIRFRGGAVNWWGITFTFQN